MPYRRFATRCHSCRKAASASSRETFAGDSTRSWVKSPRAARTTTWSRRTRTGSRPSRAVSTRANSRSVEQSGASGARSVVGARTGRSDDMAVATQGTARNYLQRAPSPSGLADVLDVILDKGLVIDAFVRVSVIGIEVLTIDARIVIASVDTYLRFAEAVNRLDLTETELAGLPELARSGAGKKAKGAVEDAGAEARDAVEAGGEKAKGAFERAKEKVRRD